MSYLAFTFEDFNNATLIADALDVHRRFITDGMLALRVHCTRNKTDETNLQELTYFFPRHQRLTGALLDFGFLEQITGTGEFKVPSMTGYLEIFASRQGGAAKSRAKKATQSKSKKRVKSVTKQADDQTDDQLDQQLMISLIPSDLTPNTYNLLKSLDADASAETATAAQKEKAKEPEPPQLVSTLPASFDLVPTAPPPPKPKRSAPHPRAAPLREKLCEVWLSINRTEYDWRGVEDNAALKRLIGKFGDEEILQRWCIAVRGEKYRFNPTHAVWHFEKNWNKYLPTQTSALTEKPRDFKACVICGGGAPTTCGGKPFCYPHFGEVWGEVGPIFDSALDEKKKQGVGFEEWQAVCVEEWLGARQT